MGQCDGMEPPNTSGGGASRSYCPKTTFASQYSEEISFEEMLQPEIINSYAKQSTGNKFLVNPHK